MKQKEKSKQITKNTRMNKNYKSKQQKERKCKEKGISKTKIANKK